MAWMIRRDYPFLHPELFPAASMGTRRYSRRYRPRGGRPRCYPAWSAGRAMTRTFFRTFAVRCASPRAVEAFAEVGWPGTSRRGPRRSLARWPCGSGLPARRHESVRGVYMARGKPVALMSCQSAPQAGRPDGAGRRWQAFAAEPGGGEARKPVGCGIPPAALQRSLGRRGDLR